MRQPKELEVLEEQKLSQPSISIVSSLAGSATAKSFA
jgi:hypothetical protein